MLFVNYYRSFAFQIHGYGAFHELIQPLYYKINLIVLNPLLENLGFLIHVTYIFYVVHFYSMP